MSRSNYSLYWDIREAIVSDVSNAVDSVSFIPFIDDINKILNRANTVLINSAVEGEVGAAFNEVMEDYPWDTL